MSNDVQAGLGSDADLWVRVRDGDMVAFRAVHDRHASRVYRHCYARLGDHAEAEEAVNQVFLAAWLRRHRITVGPAGLLPWLVVAAGNTARNHLRSLRRRRALVDRVNAEAGRGDGGDGGNAAVRGALDKLNAAGRAVVGLCLIEGYTYEEAARVLDVPVGTVRSRLSRAKDRLRGELKKMGIDYRDGSF
ncbi:RNA polymerase sigma factor [Actinokineospora auranticolor]|uniref:RNA polymerase sigma factor n=1 Tax=Actinokineospora auranticolor TaxID=155976 RepID=UPI0015E30057|nr:RNA polymerase sigma factor [Actinokineospora auranticolor]